MAVLLPPPQYDVPPSVPVIDRVMSWDEIQKFCQQRTGMVMTQGQFMYGCSGIHDGKCYIWRVDNDAVLRHERAHCAGWPANHPGGWGQ